MTCDVVFEIDGSNQFRIPYEVLRSGNLPVIAAQLAADEDVALSDVNLRFIDCYEEALNRFPIEELAEPEDADYEVCAATGGCRTCAHGTPCQTRIDADVEDILATAGLSHADALPCLKWLVQEEISSLTHDIEEMAAGFLAAFFDRTSLPYVPMEPSDGTLRERAATIVHL